VANVVVSALATWNGKALKKAQQDVNVFEKRVKSFARTFGVAFSGAALVAFSKKAIKAFSDDEAAAKSLQLQLENTGNAFRVTEVEDYIKGLEKTYAILTDLRKPFQTFLNLTRSVGLSQRTLEAALNISAGTGQSLETVVGALAAGIRGQMRSLSALNTGIDANIIKSGDMNKIMEALEKRFSGQAAARLDTYAGKMDVLKKGADEATKSIGRGLVDALEILSKDNSVASLATDFENLGDNIAYAIREIAKLTKGFTDLVSNPTFKAGLLAIAIASKSPKAVAAAFTIVGGSAVLGAATSARQLSPEENSALARARIINRRLEARIIALSTGKRKEEYEILKKKTELDKLKEKFDLELIGLQKARNEATDEETKRRLDGLIAIAKNDDALGKKALAELEAAEQLKKLAKAAQDAADAMGKFDPAKFRMGENKDLGMDAMQILAALMAMQGAASGLLPLAGMGTKTKKAADALAYGQSYSNVNVGTPGGGIFDPSFFRQGENRDLTITIDTAQTGDRFAQLIAESLQIATKSGVSYGIAGGL
jgi:hypothetical protein